MHVPIPCIHWYAHHTHPIIISFTVYYSLILCAIWSTVNHFQVHTFWIGILFGGNILLYIANAFKNSKIGCQINMMEDRTVCIIIFTRIIELCYVGTYLDDYIILGWQWKCSDSEIMFAPNSLRILQQTWYRIGSKVKDYQPEQKFESGKFH